MLSKGEKNPRHLRIYCELVGKMKGAADSEKDETNAPRCYINIRGERFSGPGVHPRFFVLPFALPRKLKSNYFDASARPGLEPIQMNFLHALLPNSLFHRALNRFARRNEPSHRVASAIYPWSITGPRSRIKLTAAGKNQKRTKKSNGSEGIENPKEIRAPSQRASKLSLVIISMHKDLLISLWRMFSRANAFVKCRK